MSQAFQAVVEGVCGVLGLEWMPGSSGIEFSTDVLQISVTELSEREGHLHLDVQLKAPSLNPQLVERHLMLLHNINEAARFEHDWVVSVGVDGTIRIHCCLLISATDATVLQLRMAEGIERGEALLAILEDTALEVPDDTTRAGNFPRGMATMIRA